MKKICSLILIAVVIAGAGLLTLSGCNPDEGVVLRILENDTAGKMGYLSYLLEQFNARYAGQGVTAVDANMDEYSDLEKEGPYGYGPDVLYQANDILMKWVYGKHIYPLDVADYEGADEIPENAWKAYRATVDGREVVCGIPVNVQQPLLYYRKDMLPENWQTQWDANGDGVPDMIQFWNEMYRYSKGIKDAGEGKLGFAMSLSNEYFNSGFIFSYGGYVFGSDNTDDTDIGYHQGDAKLGAWVMQQLAGIMDKRCIDDSFTTGRESLMASGDIFATITTPDTYTSLVTELTLTYKKDGMSEEQAKKKAEENICAANIPKLPASGDITASLDINDDSLWIDNKVMGGVNAYAISSYCKNKDWAWEFVKFATSKEMIAKRNEYLGIVAARKDVAEETGELSEVVFGNLDRGTVVLMPSLRSAGSIWTSIGSGFKKIATDGCKIPPLYDLNGLQGVLEEISGNIYQTIHTLS